MNLISLRNNKFVDNLACTLVICWVIIQESFPLTKDDLCESGCLLTIPVFPWNLNSYCMAFKYCGFLKKWSHGYFPDIQCYRNTGVSSQRYMKKVREEEKKKKKELERAINDIASGIKLVKTS